MVSVNEFPIATANEIPGFKIIETKKNTISLIVKLVKKNIKIL